MMMMIFSTILWTNKMRTTTRAGSPLSIPRGFRTTRHHTSGTGRRALARSCDSSQNLLAHFHHQNLFEDVFLFAPRARTRHSVNHDSRLAEKFVDFKKL